MTLTVAHLTTTVLNVVDRHYSGTASGINNAVSRTAGLLAIAIMGLVMLHVFSGSLTQQLATLPVPPGVRQAIEAQSGNLSGIKLPQEVSGSTRALLQHAIDQAFVDG